MKKRFLVAAMAATMVSPLAAYAEATVYGNVHLSIDSYDLPLVDDTTADELTMNSNTSAIGVKGKEDLGGGMSAIFKVEFQVDPSERNKSITDRDQWVGLKGAMGTVKFGTMSNNYKQMGGKIDPMYRTRLEGRGFLNGQSQLHSGASENGGRSTNTFQYASPKMSGVQAVFNYTIAGNDDETMGLGLRYKTKGVLAYFDYLDVQAANGNNNIGLNPTPSDSEAAIKLGGSFQTGAMTFGLQYEAVEDALGSDVIFASFNYQINDNDNFALTLADVDLVDDLGFAIMYNHKMSKRTNVYVGYGDNASDDITIGDIDAAVTAAVITQNEADAIYKFADNQIFTLGIRHKF